MPAYATKETAATWSFWLAMLLAIGFIFLMTEWMWFFATGSFILPLVKDGEITQAQLVLGGTTQIATLVSIVLGIIGLKSAKRKLAVRGLVTTATVMVLSTVIPFILLIIYRVAYGPSID